METDIFVTKIAVDKHPFIHPVSIELSSDKKRTLIITGKNGCGKTTLLEQIQWNLNQFKGSNFVPIGHIDFQSTYSQVRLATASQSNNGLLIFKSPIIQTSFDAKRTIKLTKVTAVKAAEVQTVNAKKSASEQFLQHLVNRKTQQAYALADGNESESDEITDWFSKLESYFSDIFEKSVKFTFNRNKLTFKLIDKTKSEIDLNLLSDGYSAIIHIIMRMEANKFGDYAQNGIVLIDEVETHLHVSLQKQILPLLKTFFPNIQFIVTTHSPFVLSSIEDAVIYDMERNEQIDQQADLWQYSYEALIEGYFETEKFSLILKKKINRFKSLKDQATLERAEKKELGQLEKELTNVPLYKNQAIERALKMLGLK
jgi:predicted ATP-binding protein involved in virulence